MTNNQHIQLEATIAYWGLLVLAGVATDPFIISVNIALAIIILIAKWFTKE